MIFFNKDKHYIFLIPILIISVYFFITLNNSDIPMAFESEIPLSNETEIVIWCPIASIEIELVQNYQLKYPEKRIRVVSIYEEDLENKLRSFIATDLPLPDIIVSSNTTFLADSDLFEDLASPSFSFDRSKLFEKNNEKELFTSLPRSPGLMVFLFRRDLSNRYLYSDKPHELQEKMLTWKDFLSLAETIHTNSRGNAFILPSFDRIQEIMVFQGMSNEDIESYRNILANDSSYIMGIDAGSFLYFDSFNQGDIVFFPVYNWEILYNIREFDRNLTDRWDIVSIPGLPFLGNDLSYAILKSSDNKKEAWEYTKWASLSEEANDYILNSFQIIPSTIQSLNRINWEEQSGLGSNSHSVLWKQIIEKSLKDHY